jgi:two-component system nitrate/nitrite response regulator NarP
MAKSNELSTMIVDDHTLVSSLVASELARQGISATTVETVGQALAKLKAFKADIILLDVQLESPLLLSQVRDLLKRGSPAKVALFSNDVNEDFVRSCIDVGVSGIIPKTFPLSSLTSALKLMLTGQIFVPVTMQTKPTHRELDKKFSISVDDRRVLEKLAEGMSNSDIAASLNMSESTVKMRVRGLCKKLGAENRTQVLITAQRLKLV